MCYVDFNLSKSVLIDTGFDSSPHASVVWSEEQIRCVEFNPGDSGTARHLNTMCAELNFRIHYAILLDDLRKDGPATAAMAFSDAAPALLQRHCLPHVIVL